MEVSTFLDPRKISKENDSEGRDSLADQIKDIRSERDQLNTEIEKTDEEESKRGNHWFVKLKAKLNLEDDKWISLWKKKRELTNEKEDLEDANELITAYYEKAQNSPLTIEEKKELLKPEVLSELTLDEYIALWKRLNPYYLAHVTRQGFRDHNAMMYHTAGMGEFHEGFTDSMEDGASLRPPLELQGLKDLSPESIREYISTSVLQAETQEEAEEMFGNLLNFSLGSAPKYPDKTATHFTAETVADDYYGGEQGNEVFYVYPADVLASQHSFAFNGWEKDFTKPQSEKKWNDVFVWSDQEKNQNLNINAGIVFIPRSARVDVETGSKYQSELEGNANGDEERKMVSDHELVQKFVLWGESLEDNSNLLGIIEALSKEKQYSSQRTLETAFKKACSLELENLGIDGFSSFRMSGDILITLRLMEDDDPKLTAEYFSKLIEGSGSYWKRSENTVSAEEYWENYFIENPNSKPKHIVYYDGSPSSAVRAFIKENGIGGADTSSESGQLLGFDKNYVEDMRNDPRSNKGYEELFETGKKIIEDHFSREQVLS